MFEAIKTNERKIFQFQRKNLLNVYLTHKTAAIFFKITKKTDSISWANYLFLEIIQVIAVYLCKENSFQVHCITFNYAQQENCWKPRKTSKFGPIQSTIQIWTDFHENETKKNFFLIKKIQNGRFFKIAVFQNRQFPKIFHENFMDWSLG